MIRNQFFAALALLPLFAPGANPDTAPGVPVSLVVTLEQKGEVSAPASPEELKVMENKSLRPVVSLHRLSDDKSQVLLLIDDSAGGTFDTQIPDVKRFITSLPPGADVAVGYMRNGTSQMTSEFTGNHEQAANSVRLALGESGADVSPYDSLADAVKKWPLKDAVLRREVVMISSGLEGLGGGLPPENPYVNAGIAAAQKAGIIVYAIYNPSFGHAGHSLWRATWGQNFLSQLTDETGGELYEVGVGSSVSFQPYFQDILKRQSQQYILTFEAAAEKKSGLQPVKISSTGKKFSVAAPDKVYVKASL